MNDEAELLKALEAGQISPDMYKAYMDFNALQRSNGYGRRGIDTPQERDMLQGLLGQQIAQAPAQMPQAPAPEMPMMPMPQHEALQQAEMTPMPQTNTGLETPTERDFLQQFVDSVKSPLESRGVDTPQERDFMKNIMQNYNKGHNYLKEY